MTDFARFLFAICYQILSAGSIWFLLPVCLRRMLTILSIEQKQNATIVISLLTSSDQICYEFVDILLIFYYLSMMKKSNQNRMVKWYHNEWLKMNKICPVNRFVSICYNLTLTNRRNWCVTTQDVFCENNCENNNNKFIL